jgi:hypothetical protein
MPRNTQAGLLRMPGGGSKLGCWSAAAADIAVTRPTRTTRLATRSTIVEVTFVGPAQVPQETFPHTGADHSSLVSQGDGQLHGGF